MEEVVSLPYDELQHWLAFFKVRGEYLEKMRKKSTKGAGSRIR